MKKIDSKIQSEPSTDLFIGTRDYQFVREMLDQAPLGFAPYVVTRDGQFTHQIPANYDDVRITIAPFTWAWVAAQLAAGALSYLGGRALASVMEQPAYDDVQSMIRQAVDDLKKFIRDEIRKAVEEDKIKDLESDAQTVTDSLKRYAKLPADLKERYRYLLEYSDTATLHGINLSEKYDLATLPIYASFVSLRILLIKAFYDQDKRREPMRGIRH